MVCVVFFLLVAGLAGAAYKIIAINQEYAINAWSMPHPDLRAARPIYRYSVVPGGVYSVDELFAVVQKDPIVRQHYQAVVKEAVFRQTLDHDIRAYVSFRIGNRVLWSTKKVTVKAGEDVLTDGNSMIRSRCGNLLTARLIPPETPKPPDPTPEPPEIVFETKMPPLITLPPTPSSPSGEPIFVPRHTPPPTVPASPALPLSPVLKPPIWPTQAEQTPQPPVPEPSTIVLLGTGLAILGACRGKNRNRHH